MPLSKDDENMAALNTMAANISDILSSVTAIHGPKYHDLLICLFGACAASIQITQIAEDATDYIAKSDKLEGYVTQLGASNNVIAGVNALNFTKAISSVCVHLAQHDGYKDLGVNLHTLLKRVETDFMSKIDRSPKS